MEDTFSQYRVFSNQCLPIERGCSHLSIYIAILRITWDGLFGCWKASLKIHFFLQVQIWQHATMKVDCQLPSCSTKSFLFKLLKIWSRQLESEKKLVICLELTSLNQVWVAWTQSLRVWIGVSSPFPKLE